MAAFTPIDDPSAHFQVASYTGDGNDNRQVTNDGNSNLQPDWVWIKDRTQAQSNAVFDSSRGASIRLKTDDDSQESTESATLKSFTSDGFTVGTSGTVNNGSNPDEYVAFQWKANGGTTSTNSDGDINSTVQANDTAGFSIVQHSDSSNGNSREIGHGLSAAPAMVITRARNRTENWRVGAGMNHYANGDGSYNLDDDTTFNTSSTLHTGTDSDSFGVGTDYSVNGDYNKKTIREFVDNQLLARDSKPFRDYVKELMPDVKLMFDYEGPNGNVVEEVPIPIGASFFWPESGV